MRHGRENEIQDQARVACKMQRCNQIPITFAAHGRFWLNTQSRGQRLNHPEHRLCRIKARHSCGLWLSLQRSAAASRPKPSVSQSPLNIPNARSGSSPLVSNDLTVSCMACSFFFAAIYIYIYIYILMPVLCLSYVCPVSVQYLSVSDTCAHLSVSDTCACIK